MSKTRPGLRRGAEIRVRRRTSVLSTYNFSRVPAANQFGGCGPFVEALGSHPFILVGMSVRNAMTLNEINKKNTCKELLKYLLKLIINDFRQRWLQSTFYDIRLIFSVICPPEVSGLE